MSNSPFHRPAAVIAAMALAGSAVLGSLAPAAAEEAPAASVAASAATVDKATVDQATVAAAVAAAKAGDIGAIDPSLFQVDDPQMQAAIDTLVASYPGRSARKDALAGVASTQMSDLRDDLVENAIDPSDYTCANTALSDYTNTLLTGLTLAQYLVIILYGVLDIPTYDALVFGDPSQPQAYGTDGQYTTDITHEFRDLRKFWDIYSDDIGMVAMKSDTMTDPNRIARVLAWMHGGNAADYLGTALAIQIVMAPLPYGLQNPIYTFNAFAFTSAGETDPAIAAIPDRLVMGDGILTGFEALGLGDTAWRAIMGHEFGHHVQFEGGFYAPPVPFDTVAETSRRTELMADSLAGYYLLNKHGGTLNAKTYLPSVQTFYEVGDCSFDSDGHHGTPNQRVRATEWGGDLAADAPNQGHILEPAAFDAAWEPMLPVFTAPDAS